jgi:nitrate/nitrite-specific signal transduction histidine kinase
MKKIHLRLIAGISAVFLVAYVVFMLNIGAIQIVVDRSLSLLKDNYPSVKYSFDMLHLLESVNTELLYLQIDKADSNSGTSIEQQTESNLLELQKQFDLQQNNVTEPGEKELTESLQRALIVYKKGINNLEYKTNSEAFREKYQNLREYILSIHDLNIALLETKNEEIKSSTQRIVKIQKNVGIVGLTILSIFILTIPYFLINPIDRLAARMIEFYKTSFNKDIEITKDNEVEKLEEIFEQIVRETQSERYKTKD